MRLQTLKIVMAAVLILVAGSVTLRAQQNQTMSVDKVIEMTEAGLSSETIINAIISSEQVFDLVVDDILKLKQAGVDEDVINFMLRTRPLEGDTPTESPMAESTEPRQPGDPTMQDQYYDYDGGAYDNDDPYVYTDGYNYENERASTINYHYYGPWFRAYPYYYGFYYYPASYYYWSYYPDDYYYYFYYPRFTTWRYYYYYPRYHYNRDHYRYYYSGGRYVKVKGGRYIDRTYRSSRTAVRRGNYDRNRVTTGVRRSSGYRTRDTGYTSRSSISRKDYSKPQIRTRVATPRSSISRSTSRTYKTAPVTRSRYTPSRTTTSRSSRTYSSSPSSSKRSTVKSSRTRSSRSYSTPSKSSRSSSSKSSSSRSARRK